MLARKRRAQERIDSESILSEGANAFHAVHLMTRFALWAGTPFLLKWAIKFVRLSVVSFLIWELVMAIERTLSIVKPDAVAKNVIGKIYSRFETNGLKIIAARMAHLSRAEAEGFYAVHRERPFFKDLVEYMMSGPVMIQVLEGESAIAKNRELMGATDPKKAASGTIRADFAESIEANAVHGSDGPETAAFEIGYFFPGSAIFSR